MSEWLHDNPWRQGHALTLESAQALGLLHPGSSDDTVAVVVSHDCDLASQVSVEPTCEVIVGRRIASLDGNLTNAKSIRRLHLTFSEGATASSVELEIVNRFQVKKTDLAGHLPDDQVLLTSHERSLLQAWLAARYSRPSFPDAFVRRLTGDAHKTYKKIEKRLANASSHILMVLFDLDEGRPDTERQGDGDLYSLSIYLVFSAEEDPASSKIVADGAAAELTNLFESEFKKNGGWRNIELVSCEAVSEEEVTLRMWRLTRRWYLDHVSFRGGQVAVNQ